MANNENLKPFTSETAKLAGGGRPKGVKNRATVYRKLLEMRADLLPAPEAYYFPKKLGMPKDISIAELLAIKAVCAAFGRGRLGFRYLTYVEDSAYGKMTRDIDIIQESLTKFLTRVENSNDLNVIHKLCAELKEML